MPEAKTKGQATREKIIQAAISLFNTRGLKNTSLNDIIHATGVKKGNLYFHFASKDDMCREIILAAKENYFDFLKQEMTGETPLEQLFNLLDAVSAYHSRKNFVGGCIFGNTALEMADTDSNFTDLILDIFNEWISLLADLVEQAQRKDEINPDLDPDAMARHIVATAEGGIMMARLSKRPKDLDDCLNSLKTWLSQKLH